MSSRARMLTILDYFSEAAAWTTEELIARLGCSQPTAYRYVRELCDAGLLLRISGGLYVLGPRILELDLIIRRSDPVMRAAQPVMRDLVEQSHGDVLLANVYGDQVMNVHREDGPHPTVISYDRGRPHPLFRGSTSKAVLPFLPRAQLKRIYEAHADECHRAGMGRSWEDFAAALAPIRRNGYIIGYGELDPHVVGIAAPVFAEEKRVLGSITLILAKQRYELLDKGRLLDLVLQASRSITNALRQMSVRSDSSSMKRR